ncbi:uncharacterized protein LOC110016709 isoform X3 [Oryzias latipes]
MEEEIQHSSVVFKGRAAASRTEVQASGSRFHHLLCFGIICFLLCVIINVAITYFAMETKKLKKNLSDLDAKNEQLTLEKRDLQNQTEDLRMSMTKLTAEKLFFKNQTKEMTVNMTILQNQNEQLRNSDKLNKILAAIISYSNFPADVFCPNEVSPPLPALVCIPDWTQLWTFISSPASLLKEFLFQHSSLLRCPFMDKNSTSVYLGPLITSSLISSSPQEPPATPQIQTMHNSKPRHDLPQVLVPLHLTTTSPRLFTGTLPKQ